MKITAELFFWLICIPLLIITFPMVVLGETARIIRELLEKAMEKIKQ